MKLTTLVSIAIALASPSDAVRVHRSVHRALQAQGTVNIFVTLKDGTSQALNAINEADFGSREQKIASLIENLERHAAESQKEVASLLVKEASTQLFTKTRTFWITNQIYIENASIELLEKLVTVSSIAEIMEEQVVSVARVTESPSSSIDNSTVAEWGISRINAEAVWATGNYGQNTVVGIIDTGVRSTHVAIAKNYLDNGFSWLDPQNHTVLPYDDVGHGTHVTGTIAGTNGIGVAPEAKWMACKGCRTRDCYASDILACFEFMTCPTNPQGTVKDCSKAPRIVSNSWRFPRGSTLFVEAMKAWHAAGIIPVFANGNDGPNCTAVGSPADMDNTIGVGSTDTFDALAWTSSRGPSLTGVIKPDVSAPGVDIRSAYNTDDSSFRTLSGTSMATPHVSGVIALMLSAKPDLTYAQVKDALTKTTVQTLIPITACGGTPSTVWPNNQYGHGRIDAHAVVEYVKNV